MRRDARGCQGSGRPDWRIHESLQCDREATAKACARTILSGLASASARANWPGSREPNLIVLGFNPMPAKSETFEKHAEECRCRVDKARTRDLRQLFLELAADWSELAGLRRRLEADGFPGRANDRLWRAEEPGSGSLRIR